MTPTSEVIRLAHEAGLVLACDMADGYIRDGKYANQLARLISLAKAEEREACAQIAMLTASNGIETSAAIRARTKEAP